MNRSRRERELREEMDAHREMAGVAEFGNAVRLREEAREEWSWRWLEQAGQDLRYGLRVLLKAPGFTLGAVVILALGIGVNLAEFQVFDAMIFHRLQVRDVGSIVEFHQVAKAENRLGFPAGAVDFYRTQSSSFAWLISEDGTARVTVDGESGLTSTAVQGDYFGSLGVRPMWGRMLQKRDEESGGVAVLGHGYWRTHWAADPKVVGRLVRLNNRPTRIVGVLPANFDGFSAARTAVWVPRHAQAQELKRVTETLFGKLKSGVSLAAGEAELTSLTNELAHREPGAFPEGDTIRGELVQANMRRVLRSPAVAIFVVMILLVLFSACANLGNMLLARGMSRQREIGIRLAIGAGRGRLVRQLMTENLLLALAGSAAGLGFGAVAGTLLMRWLGAPPDIRITIGWPVVATGAALTLVSVVGFGLPAALQAVGVRPKVRMRQGLVAVQVAVSCLLLISSAVLARDGIAVSRIDLAFDYNRMVVVDSQSRALAARVKELPGVDGVAEVEASPIGGRVPAENSPGLPRIYSNAVEPGYFNFLRLPVIRGRVFAAGEKNAAVVSETAARRIWPGEDPLGKPLSLGGRLREVTGVVGDSGANLFADEESVEAYVPLEKPGVLLVHARSEVGPLLRSIANLEDGVSVSPLRVARDRILEARSRLIRLIASIGMVATTLAAAGMFALVAFAVTQRRREFGIRLAIGARPKHILGVLLRQNAGSTAAGMVVGSILAMLLYRLVRTMIFVRSHDGMDAIGIGAGVGCFLLVAILAILSPALRALRIDPASTLREE